VSGLEELTRGLAAAVQLQAKALAWCNAEGIAAISVIKEVEGGADEFLEGLGVGGFTAKVIRQRLEKI